MKLGPKIERADFVCTKHEAILRPDRSNSASLQSPGWVSDSPEDGVWEVEFEDMICPRWTEDDECQDYWGAFLVED